MRHVVFVLFLAALLLLPISAVAQQVATTASLDVGRWEADTPELLQLQITVVTPDGRIFGSHRLSDFADGRREYFPFEGKAVDGRFTYTVEVESGRPLSYILWRDGEKLRGYLVGHPERLITFTRRQ